MGAENDVQAIHARALNTEHAVSDRMRAIFALKSLGDVDAIRTLCICMRLGDSVLVKHEAAYCLGQMQNSIAVPDLEACLQCDEEDVIVRHEAAEALGAIRDPVCLELLDRYSREDCPREIYETCQIAAARIRETCADKPASQDCVANELPKANFQSVDPASAFLIDSHSSVDELLQVLCDGTASIYERYKAMFSLRNMGNEASVAALCEGMVKEKHSALFRHEIAFVLGQLQHPSALPTLRMFLQNRSEHEMVRHEAAEALGSIATPECFKVLETFLREDENRIVRESAAVALDIAEYNSDESAFQYADTVSNKVR